MHSQTTSRWLWGEATSASRRVARTHSVDYHPQSILEESTLLFRLSICRCKVVCVLKDFGDRAQTSDQSIDLDF